ncbi:GCR1-dependent translation factor 1, partial [Coemansia biformis]
MDDLLALVPSGLAPAAAAAPMMETFHATDAAAAAGLAAGSDSFIASVLMIFVSEIGDKTFLIAAILAMSNPRLTIFLAACSALWLMSILSAFLGHAVVTVIPMAWVSIAAAVMFLVFGIKLLQEARGMDGSEIAKEMHNVESELNDKDEAKRQVAMETGDAQHDDAAASGGAFNVNVSDQSDEAAPPHNSGSSSSNGSSVISSLKNLLGLLLSPIFVETFVLVFLA